MSLPLLDDYIERVLIYLLFFFLTIGHQFHNRSSHSQHFKISLYAGLCQVRGEAKSSGREPFQNIFWTRKEYQFHWCFGTSCSGHWAQHRCYGKVSIFVDNLTPFLHTKDYWNMILILNLSMLVSSGMGCFLIIYSTDCWIYFLRCYHTSYVHITTLYIVFSMFAFVHRSFVQSV